jgi:AraC family transcriptional regulator
VSAYLGTRPPLRVERYIFQARRQLLPALPLALLVVHLGGARVSGGGRRGTAGVYLPSFALFLPAGHASEWTLEGAVDVAGVYLPTELGERFARIARRSGPGDGAVPFTDRLVSALSQQIVDGLGSGATADARYLADLGRLLVRQTERVLAGRAGQRIVPPWIQLGRLKVVLEHIDRNLGGDLSNAALARQAGVGTSYFRRLFTQALGHSPNRYVQGRRLDRARVLLAETNLPLARIAGECGFGSQSYLTTSFKARHGVTPARFRHAVQWSTARSGPSWEGLSLTRDRPTARAHRLHRRPTPTAAR